MTKQRYRSYWHVWHTWRRPLPDAPDLLAELGMDDIYDDDLSEEENYKKVVVELYDFRTSVYLDLAGGCGS